MSVSALLEKIQNGEDSKTQFKENIHHVNQLAQEFVVFSNSERGILLIDVKNNGEISGLSFEEIEKINQHISNAASQNVKPPIAPFTENIAIDGKKIICAHIFKGIAKPY